MTDQPKWTMTDYWLERVIADCGEVVWDAMPFGHTRSVVSLAITRALAEQEKRHRRELIEARIDTLTAHGDCVCPIYSVYGERLSAVDPECVVCSALKRLESELAALEVKP